MNPHKNMKSLLKILALSVTLALSALTAISAAVLSRAASFFALAGSLLGVLALVVLFSGNAQNALILAALALAVSPVGLPMLAVRFLGGLQGINHILREHLYQ